MKKAIILALAISIASITACSEVPPTDAAANEKPESIGIAIGAAMPIDMPLRDSSGTVTALNQQMGPKGIVLVMGRSVDWCPYCKAQFAGINDAKADIEQRGYKLVALSYDSPKTLNDFAKVKALSYTMLSDSDSKLIDATGVRDPQYGADSIANGVPYPTILVIGVDGTVKAKRVDTDFTVLPTNAEMMSLLAA